MVAILILILAAFGPTIALATTDACADLMGCGPLKSPPWKKPSASGDGAVAIGESARATGHGAIAVGIASATAQLATALGQGRATGYASTAFGYLTTAAGHYAVAMGTQGTTASGFAATAMGERTVAGCGGAAAFGACTAMGFQINNTEVEALVNSGNVHAKNIHLFGADSRLAQNATDADSAALLDNVERLRVVERAPSAAYCKHQRRDPGECARDRAVALLAQQVQRVVPGAVGSGASLTLVDAAEADSSSSAGLRAREAPPVLEEVDDVLGLDVHALLAQLVGSVQELSRQNKRLAQKNRALARRVAALEHGVSPARSK